MSGAAQIDFSSIGGKPVSSPPSFDFSSIGGKPVQMANQTANPGTPSQTATADASPSLLDRLKSGAETLVDTLPGPLGLANALHRGAGYVQDWAQSKEPLKGASPGPTVPVVGDVKQLGAGMLADTAGLVKGATSPAGLATTGAAIVAPEVVGPALVAHGGYSAVKGWGDLANPDVLQNELNAGAEIAGGAAVTGGAIRSGGGPVTQAIREKVSPSTQAPAQATQDLQTAIPASKSAPYADIDMQKARPYLEAEHGNTPIDSVAGLRDAADSAIGKIEDQIEQKISQLPNARFKTNAIQNVTKALQANHRGQAFVDAGLKDIEDFNLDQPKTLAEVDAIRRQLNLENQATLAQNNYKVAVARASDPGFAAREAAAESLRDGIYAQLGANGMPEAQQLRLDEGSLIKIRNAAQNQIFNGEKVVRSTAQNGPVRQVAKAVTKSGAAAVGAAAAGWPGAIAGSQVGESLGGAFTPEGLTRNELIERSFAKPVATVPPAKTAPVIAPVPAAVSSTAAQPNTSSRFGSIAALRNLLGSRSAQ